MMANLNSFFQFLDQQQLPREIKWSSFSTSKYSFGSDFSDQWKNLLKLYFSQFSKFVQTVGLIPDYRWKTGLCKKGTDKGTEMKGWRYDYSLQNISITT